MAVLHHPTTYPTLSFSLLPSSTSTHNNHIHRVSFPSITYPTLSYASTNIKSSNYNVQVLVEDDEPEDKLVLRFRKEVLNAGILQESRRRRFFENKVDKIKRKAREASRRNRKRRPYFRIPPQNKYESSNKEKDDDDDDEEEDNWEVSDVDLPYS